MILRNSDNRLSFFNFTLITAFLIELQNNVCYT